MQQYDYSCIFEYLYVPTKMSIGFLIYNAWNNLLRRYRFNNNKRQLPQHLNKVSITQNLVQVQAAPLHVTKTAGRLFP